MVVEMIIGMLYTEAVRFIEANDLWAEVLHIETNAEGVVIGVWH